MIFYQFFVYKFRKKSLINRILPVRIWLYSIAILVSIMIVVGGATRLTDSGLSITEWAPLSGIIPPLSLSDWLEEFEKYQTTTEFKTINNLITLDEFKSIYWWEWTHRFLGRFIGCLVVIPMMIFWVSGHLNHWLKLRLIFLLFLGSLQGVIGWWMVESGLFGQVDVSHLRLAVHLTLACLVLSLTIWLAQSVDVYSWNPVLSNLVLGFVLLFMIFVQIFLGGLVAGLDAGMSYNTWPLMNGNFFPQDLWSTNLRDDLTWIDNIAIVQFLHRLTSYFIFILSLIHVLQLKCRNMKLIHVRRCWGIVFLILIQVLLGIVTLVSQVPIEAALLHQLGAIIIIAFLTVHLHALSSDNPSLLKQSNGSF
ncbi:COX15/CtaA family protein [Candidatus Endowatersipora endosymbiont of Watersipora subatra]|uniref:COX15/CtaA family protein n=1 Tax=Candidatus Endowatersipora endosymbiont of Watersipora subatra TaxID=3077946 RepID=UPI00312C8B96